MPPVSSQFPLPGMPPLNELHPNVSNCSKGFEQHAREHRRNQ
jgi:hypothetical protein